jgi:hypothetical protein
MDLKTMIASGVAGLMGIMTAVQEFRVMGLDTALGSVSQAKEKAEGALKETRDGLVTGSKRQDAVILDLQDQLSKATTERDRTKADLTSTQARLEAAQANTQRMADLAEKLCRKPR